MDDLAAFLKARLNEAEREAECADGGITIHYASAAGAAGSSPWAGGGGGSSAGAAIPGTGGGGAGGSSGSPQRFRMLREVAAKQHRLERYLEAAATYQRSRHGADMMVRDALALEVREDAAVYSGHPDYRPEWKLEPGPS